MGAPPFEVAVNWEEGNPVVRVRGELDFATAPALREALDEAIASGAQNMILDFHEVTFLDSEGLKVLLDAYRQLRDQGGSMTVHGCSRFVAKTFEILGLETQFGICKEEDEGRA